jgi:hypothetical protein
MSDQAPVSGPPTRPGVVDVMSPDVVEPLVARHEQELKALRLELEQATKDADAAEQRVRQNPLASVYDADFEAGVLDYLARSVANITTVPAPGWSTTSDAQRSASPPVVADDQSAQSPSSSSSSPARPRPVSGEGGRPRTTVVRRGGPVANATPPSPPTAAAATGHSEDIAVSPVVTPDPVASTGSVGAGRIETQAKKRSAGGASRVPARLLIQVGVVIVVLALLLLKLG